MGMKTRSNLCAQCSVAPRSHPSFNATGAKLTNAQAVVAALKQLLLDDVTAIQVLFGRIVPVRWVHSSVPVHHHRKLIESPIPCRTSSAMAGPADPARGQQEAFPVCDRLVRASRATLAHSAAARCCS